jgi:hypothetical protein
MSKKLVEILKKVASGTSTVKDAEYLRRTIEAATKAK